MLSRARLPRSGYALHQQQGLWATHWSVEGRAFRYVFLAKTLSVSTLLAHASPEPPRLRQASGAWHVQRPIASLVCPATVRPAIDYFPRLRAASRFWDAERYDVWDDVMMCAIALKAWGREEELFDLLLAYCQRGSARATAKNDLPQYSPAHIFSTREARMPPEAALGVLFRMAQDGALDVLERARRHGMPKEDVDAAGLYLATYHPNTFATHRALNALAGGEHA